MEWETCCFRSRTRPRGGRVAGSQREKDFSLRLICLMVSTHPPRTFPFVLLYGELCLKCARNSQANFQCLSFLVSPFPIKGRQGVKPPLRPSTWRKLCPPSTAKRQKGIYSSVTAVTPSLSREGKELNRLSARRRDERFSLKPSPAEKVPRNEADEEIILKLNVRSGQLFYGIISCMMLSSSPASGPPSPLEKALNAFATTTDGIKTLTLFKFNLKPNKPSAITI